MKKKQVLAVSSALMIGTMNAFAGVPTSVMAQENTEVVQEVVVEENKTEQVSVEQETENAEVQENMTDEKQEETVLEEGIDEKAEVLTQEKVAGEEEKLTEENEIAYEAMIGDTSYATLKEALLVGGEVQLLKDVSVNEIIEITKDTTLDLGDFIITDNAPKRPFVVRAENFTIKANQGGMVIPESNKQAYGFVEAYVNNFSILGGNYKGNTDNGRLFRINAPESKTGNVNVDSIIVNTNNEIIGHKDTFMTFNGTITNSEFYTDTRAMYFDVIDTTEASTLTISNTKAVVNRGPVIEVAGGNTVLSNNDWNVTGNYEGGYSWARAAVGVGYRANVTIKSGNYLADSEFMKANEGYGVYIYTSGGTVNIEGGNFAGTTGSLRADVDKGTYNYPANIIVNGGEFIGDLLAKTNTGIENIKVNAGNFNRLTDTTLNANNNVQIEGGVFDLDVTKKVSEGKETIAVTKKDNTNYYIGKEKVNEALNNVTTGDKVNIIQNVTDVKIPDGVEVENSTGNDITVNGDVIKDNETVIVDEVPTATVTYSNNGDWTNKDVTVTIKASEAINDIIGWTKVDESTFTKVFADNDTETLTITDMTGNSIKVRVDVKNIDKYAPEIRGIKDVSLVQGEKFDPLEGIFAYDNECGELKDVKVSPSSLDTNVLGVYELEYTVSDLAGNVTTVKRKVTVNPKEEILNCAPAISVNDVILNIGDAFDPLKDVTATDKEDGTITLTKDNVIANDVDTSRAGIYHVTYKVTDKNGASTEKTITVTVKQNTGSLNSAPTISATDITLSVGDIFDPLANITATDKEDGTITLTKDNVIANDVDTSRVGIYHVTYKVTDKNGASTEKTITVTVKEKAVNKPVNPQQPQKPNKPTAPTKPNGQKNPVKTGDVTNIGLFASMFAGSTGALAVLFSKKRKKK